MAMIVGAVATSHTPTIGFAFDRDKRNDPAWTLVFSAFDPVRAWLEQQKPDVLFLVYNDHITSFFFDHYSAFALGIGERWDVADESGGARDLPAAEGDPAFAAHRAQRVASAFSSGLFWCCQRLTTRRGRSASTISPVSKVCASPDTSFHEDSAVHLLSQRIPKPVLPCDPRAVAHGRRVRPLVLSGPRTGLRIG